MYICKWRRIQSCVHCVIVNLHVCVISRWSSVGLGAHFDQSLLDEAFALVAFISSALSVALSARHGQPGRRFSLTPLLCLQPMVFLHRHHLVSWAHIYSIFIKLCDDTSEQLISRIAKPVDFIHL